MEDWSNLKKKKTLRWKSQKSQTLETEAQRVNADVLHALGPICYVGKVCGLLPIKLAKNKLDHMPREQTDFPLLAYGITLALALTGTQCWGLYRDLHSEWQADAKIVSKLSVIVVSSDVFIAIILTWFAVFGSSCRWKHVLHALHKIVEADEQLNFTTTKNLRRSSIILITCTLIYIISASIFALAVHGIQVAGKSKEKKVGKGPFNYYPFYLMQTMIIVMQMEYAIILMNLNERFTKLNFTIENITKNNVTTNHMGIAVQEPRFEILQKSDFPNWRRQSRQRNSCGVTHGCDKTEPNDQLIKVYDLLCDSIIYLNKAFGSQLLICTFSCLVHLVVTFYLFWFNLHDPKHSWYSLVTQIIWIIVYIYKMFLVVQPPHTVTSKARNTGSLVSQALAIKWNPQGQKQLESFAIKLLHRPVEFTACGLFCLDRGLMASVAGAVTTYLMILVQFRGNNNDHNDTTTLLQSTSILLKNASGVEDS